MSLSSHLEELRKKHETLSERVETAQQHPSSDDLEIMELKKRKLWLKQEIQRLGGA